MPFLIGFASFVVSGVVFRIIASVVVGLMTASFVRGVVSDYLNKAFNLMNSSMSSDISALLGIAGVDNCLSVMAGGISFIAVYKSLKLIFVRS